MRPLANNQGRRWDEISCCLESNPLVSDKNLPESKQDKIIVVSSHGKKQKKKQKQKTNGIEGSGWKTTYEGGEWTKVSIETIHGEIRKS